MSNSHANVPSAKFNRYENMAGFDKLPKAVREALRYSTFNWSAESIRRKMSAKKIKAAQVVVLIAERDESLSIVKE